MIRERPNNKNMKSKSFHALMLKKTCDLPCNKLHQEELNHILFHQIYQGTVVFHHIYSKIYSKIYKKRPKNYGVEIYLLCIF